MIHGTKTNVLTPLSVYQNSQVELLYSFYVSSKMKGHTINVSCLGSYAINIRALLYFSCVTTKLALYFILS